jgi:type VI secretion system protein ImpF
VAFEIQADLWAQPVPLRLALVTEVHLEDGHIDVRDAGARKGA